MTTSVVVFYVLGAGAVALLLVLRNKARRGSGGPLHDRYEAAFLNGGPARVVDSALAGLHHDGRLAVGGPGIVRVLRPVAYDPVERAVLQELGAAPHGALAPLRYAVMRHPAVQETGGALADRGLIMEPRARRALSRWSMGLSIVAVLMAPVSVMMTVVEFMGPGDHAPFVLRVLPVLAAVLATGVVCATAAAGRVTPAGRAAVGSYGREHLHEAHPGMLVALHGLRALPDPVLREQLATAARTRLPSPVRPSSSSSSSTWSDDAAVLPVTWCAASAGGEGGGCGGGSSCSSGGSSCSAGGSSCSSGGSSCSSGGSSCSSGGSSCSSSSSSCSSSSSSCSSSSSSCSSSSS
ncbi:TIGR04222 domain-containing membrane protein [Streptomyces sp. NPDC053493]|uniref:TIGR04222 domain-containing membrane protein n=1 Tax=Streptomyces sp. NPDC053493 TaxID=3365705 RepID=UPI0037CFA172